MTASALTAERAVPLTRRVDNGQAGSWLLGFGAIAYLGIEGGGYDVVVRSQVGIAVWWIVLAGAALGVLPRRGVGRPALGAIGLLAAFAAWSASSAGWSASAEHALGETARVVTLLGLVVLAVATVRERHVRALVSGTFAAIVLVGALACLSRLHPAWFGAAETGELMPNTRNRLAYPLNYWNALAALMAIGWPLGMAIGASARTIAGRALAVASLPVLGLTTFLTLSRGGIAATAIALLAAFALTPDRTRWLGKLGLAAAGTAILVKGALQRDELRSGLSDAVAHHQGDELLLIVLVVVAGVALVHVGLALAGAVRLVPTLPRVSTGYASLFVVAGIGFAISAALAAGAPGALSHRWHDFKTPQLPAGHGTDYNRLAGSSGTGRYQLWSSAMDAFDSAPLKGVGTGSFETWWNKHATMDLSVRNAHSLYAETLAELGVLGFGLLAALMLLVLAGGIASVRRSTGPPRVIAAGATAACLSFVVSAAIDWAWQVTVLPACFLLLAVGLLTRDRGGDGVGSPVGARVAVGALAVVAIVALAVPLAGATNLRDSQRAANARRLDAALRASATAARLQPYAFSPALQRALVLELAGDIDGAVVAARAAERKEPGNWRGPLVLARLEAESGDVPAALAAYRRAKTLNRHTSLLR